MKSLVHSAPWLGLAGVTLAFVALALAFELLMDDAYISSRYADNLARGQGLVFNAGERVEGYSNFSWTVILAALLRLGIDPVAASRVLGVVWGAAVVAATGWAMVRLRGRLDAAALAATVLVAANVPLALWSTSGMETSFFTLLVTLAVVLWMLPAAPDRARWGACVLFALGALTRPDGALFFGSSFLALPASAGRRRVQEALAFCLPLAVHLGWKWQYYGELLPNTYYAKAGITLEYLDRGLAYAGEALRSGGVLLLPFLILAAWHPVHARFARRVLAVCVVVVAYVIGVGGDVLPVQRFWVPLVPLGAMLTALGVETLVVRWVPQARVATFVGSTGLAVIVLAAMWGPTQHTRAQWQAALDRMENMGQWIGANLQPEESVAATAIGAIAYYSDRRVVDMLGLTNPEVARHPDPVRGLSDTWKEKRYNAAAVLRATPTLILFSTGARPSAAGEKALFLYEEFHRAYATFHFRSDPSQEIAHVAYRLRRDATVGELGVRSTELALVDEFERGITVSQSGQDPLRAVARFEAALAAAPFDFPIAREWLAISLYQARRDDALPALRAVVEADPHALVAWRFLGSVALREGDLDEAERCFQHLRDFEPHEPFGWAGLGEIAARRGDLARARTLTRESLHRWSTNSRAQRLMAALDQAP